jgi:putative ATP-binding cassette transporter
VLSYLIQQSRSLLLAAAAASIVSGICAVVLVAQINAALVADSAGRAQLAWVFAGVALAAMASHMLASVLFERLGQQAQAQLRRHVCDHVLAADYRRLEEVGAARLQSALAEHCGKVAEFFVFAPTILVNGIIVAGCLVYMMMLSVPIFVAAVLVIGLGSLGYHVAHLRAIKHLDVASREQDRLFGHFKSLIEGAKELRLNSSKREAFSKEVLGESIQTVQRERTRGMSIFLVSTSWGNFLVYAFIGLVLFALVADVPDRARIMTGFALVFLYMVTPLESLLINLPRANLARVAAQRIDEVVEELAVRHPQVMSASTDNEPATLDSVALCGVQHRYYHEGEDDLFTLGPVDLAFLPSQVTFLVGGNGSGKTSLAKLLVGLYEPEQGDVLLNGERVDPSRRDQYRQSFSTVFSDYHLFDRLLQVRRRDQDLDERGNRLLERLQLSHKVQVRHGAFTTQALSQGQRKRLALVAALLEDRPFLVFDEWAADQDPQFKDVFYREVLAELRAMGKTVLVITHDDRYFHLADRVVRMENGQILSVSEARQADPVVPPVAIQA